MSVGFEHATRIFSEVQLYKEPNGILLKLFSQSNLSEITDKAGRKKTSKTIGTRVTLQENFPFVLFLSYSPQENLPNYNFLIETFCMYWHIASGWLLTTTMKKY